MVPDGAGEGDRPYRWDGRWHNPGDRGWIASALRSVWGSIAAEFGPHWPLPEGLGTKMSHFCPEKTVL